MIKTYRLKNLLMAGQITGPELEALLQKRDYLGALYDLRNDKVWMADIAQSPMALTVLAASETALAVVATSETVMAAVAASETAMAAVAASETVMAAVAASETALAAVAASETAMAAISASATARAALLAKAQKVTCPQSAAQYNAYTLHTGKCILVKVVTSQGTFGVKIKTLLNRNSPEMTLILAGGEIANLQLSAFQNLTMNGNAYAVDFYIVPIVG